MRIVFFLNICFAICFYQKAYGQFRNSFVGKYYCLVKNQTSTQTSYENRDLYVYIDSAYPNRIILADSLWNPGQFITPVNLYTDSTFRDTIWSASGGLFYGHFYDLDSIYFHRAVLLGPGGGALMEYWGVKLLSTEFTQNDGEQTSRFFPNPTSHKLFIKTQNGREIEACRLYTMNGKELALCETEKGEYDISLLPNGTYFLQMKSSDAIITKKIIIEH